jgi:hypothetical protein
MATTANDEYLISIPKKDSTFFKMILKKMEWKLIDIKRKDIPNDITIHAIKDAKTGKTVKCKSAKDMIDELNN